MVAHAVDKKRFSLISAAIVTYDQSGDSATLFTRVVNRRTGWLQLTGVGVFVAVSLKLPDCASMACGWTPLWPGYVSWLNGWSLNGFWKAIWK